MAENNQAGTKAGYFAGFPFQGGGEWVRISADLGELGRIVGEQVRRAVAEVDFDAIRQEIDRSMQTMAEGFRKASAEWPKAECWKGPGRIFVDIAASKAPGDAAQTTPDRNQDERMIVVRLVAQGKITPEEGARLLEALAR